MRRQVIIFMVLALAAGVALAGDWPQWRGEKRDGRSTDEGLLQSWPEGGPELAWQTKGLGSGYSSLAVTGGRIYTMGDLAEGQHVIALEDGTGKLLWKRHVGPAHDDKYIGSRSTPTVVGERLYVTTTEGEVYCLSTADGSVVWKRHMVDDFGGFLMKAMGQYDWKYSESPLVDEGRVIVTPGAADALLVALDAKSGKTLWRTEGTAFGERGADGAGYSSPVVFEGAGKRQYVQLVGRGLVGVDAGSGKLLWSYNAVANDVANISTPVVHEDKIFVSTGYGTGSALVQVEAGEGGYRAKELYFVEPDTLQNHHGGVLLDAGTIYTGTGHNKGFPIAADLATGKILWGPARNDGNRSAAIAYADGRLYFRYENGWVVLIEATRDGYKEHGSMTIPDVAQFSWPHPVIAGGKLYLREQDRLYVYDVER